MEPENTCRAGLPSAIRRRAARGLAGLAFAGLALAAAQPAAAQAYPDRPVRVVVPFAAGGATDIFARLIAERLTKATGQPFIVENKPGAGGNTGSDAVARSAPDGYTLVLGTVSSHAINPSLYAKPPYDVEKDFEPVAMVATIPNVLVVNPNNVKATTVADFIAEAKAAKRPLLMASSGSGSSIHLSGEVFKQATATNLEHVPYKGSGPAVIDLVGGQVDLMFDNLPSAIGQVKAGKLRAIAVTSAEPSPALPGVPTVAATVPGFEAVAWLALFAPAGTPKAIVDKLNAEVRAAYDAPEVRRRYVESGAAMPQMTPEQLAAFVKAEGVKWAAAVKASGARVD
ncbi:tripartite tricarboxylate transporter substrate binding protein [Xanthobacter pseudotagetidis]|uniref:tripartite tricarboxylate transporter substrate binding protein n=1 Tax=Xanthobacter pseudotagetidis TaxID=3119911 RepID=UPI00372CB69A